VGRAVGELNKLLPKKQFILMGPGRWGSRGDIKLGVSVTYADINSTSLLIEVARRKSNYVPDVSFGTHFFQDLVEAGIGYLPLYPDDEGIQFNQLFLNRSENLLPELLPDFADLADVVKVIDVPEVTEGRILRILFNADLDEAVAYLADPGGELVSLQPAAGEVHKPMDQFWRWRRQMVDRIAAELDREKMGVKAFYLFGSVKNASAGPASDIDLLVHVTGDKSKEKELLDWLDGWSRCLAEFNYQRTGYRTDGLLDVHLVTDKDIENRSSFAVKIGAVTDAAQELPRPDEG
ncbi:pyruvate, phosphate dikinase, partial [bacterium CG17_big_fil_post_rev_8_21_14_2_50_64_8]